MHIYTYMLYLYIYIMIKGGSQGLNKINKNSFKSNKILHNKEIIIIKDDENCKTIESSPQPGKSKQPSIEIFLHKNKRKNLVEDLIIKDNLKKISEQQRIKRNKTSHGSITKDNKENNIGKREQNKINKWFEVIHSGNIRKIKQLIKKGRDINIQNEKGDTALIITSFNGETPIVELLLNNYAHVNTKNNKGETALILASTWGHTEIVRLLLARHANIHIKDNNGKTALMYAASRDYIETANVLIDNGADIDILIMNNIEFSKQIYYHWEEVKRKINEIVKEIEISNASEVQRLLSDFNIENFRQLDILLV